MLLKIDPEFGIYALSLKKAVKGLIQAGFTKSTDLDKILSECVCTTVADRRHKIYNLHTPDVLLHLKVTPSTVPVDLGGFSGICDIIQYDVEGEDVPMNFGTILDKYKHNRMTEQFVAVCRKGADGKLELTGIVF